MEELNNMNLDDLLKVSADNNSMSGKLVENIDLDVSITKDEEVPILKDGETSSVIDETKEENPEWTNETWAAHERELAMSKMAEYESYVNAGVKLDGELAILNTELEELISKVRLENKELIDKINAKANEIDANNSVLDKLKEELLPLQKEIYLCNSEDKTLKYNKIQSTYVAATEKNQFDLKAFREEQTEFWNTNLEVLKPYSKITPVSDYLKITISKK